MACVLWNDWRRVWGGCRNGKARPQEGNRLYGCPVCWGQVAWNVGRKVRTWVESLEDLPKQDGLSPVELGDPTGGCLTDRWCEERDVLGRAFWGGLFFVVIPTFMPTWHTHESLPNWPINGCFKHLQVFMAAILPFSTLKFPSSPRQLQGSLQLGKEVWKMINKCWSLKKS